MDEGGGRDLVGKKENENSRLETTRKWREGKENAGSEAERVMMIIVASGLKLFVDHLMCSVLLTRLH